MRLVTAFSIRQSSDYYELHGPTQSADHAVPTRPPGSGSADILEEDYSHSPQTGETEGLPFAPPQPEPFEVVEPVDQTDNGPVGVQATTSVKETGDLPEVLAERYEVRESIGGWSVQDREIDDVAENEPRPRPKSGGGAESRRGSKTRQALTVAPRSAAISRKGLGSLSTELAAR